MPRQERFQSNRKWVLALYMVASLFAGLPSRAGEPSPLAGHYYLMGVREVGSELVLRADHTFSWMLSYGAVDQSASGTWSASQKEVTLQATQPVGAPAFRLFREEELRIRKPADPGTWIAIVGMPRVGPIAVPVEVVFETATKQQLSATTNQSGDAVIASPTGETWARAGLRRKDSSDALQWFVVPKDRSADRIACFAVDDAIWISPQPFKQMTLRIRGAELVAEVGSYTKQP